MIEWIMGSGLEIKGDWEIVNGEIKGDAMKYRALFG